jgi:hypothetical protein
MQREILHFTWWSVGCHQSCENNKKHELAIQNKASNSSVRSYLSSKNINEMEKLLLQAAQEATLLYHTAVHNHSFKSMNCTTAIMRKISTINLYVHKNMESNNYRCFYAIGRKQILQELKEACFISVLID